MKVSDTSAIVVVNSVSFSSIVGKEYIDCSVDLLTWVYILSAYLCVSKVKMSENFSRCLPIHGKGLFVRFTFDVVSDDSP